MLSQLIFNNLFFAVHLTAFLSLFIAGWLHLDSWKVNKKDTSYLVRSIGFFTISTYFLYSASQTENILVSYIFETLKIYGAVLLLFGLVSNPILTLKKPKFSAFMLPFAVPLALVIKFSPVVTGIVYLLISVSYFVRATKGLEKQIKMAGFAFVFFTISEALSIFYIWQDSSVVFINQALSSFGTVSILIIISQLIASVILLIWVWNYIRFRVEIQLYVTTLLFTLSVFLMTTFSFTYLLLKNIEASLLSSIETDTKVVLYTIERLQFEALANSKSAATDPKIADGDFKKANEFMISQSMDFLNVVDENGNLIVSAEDEDLKNVGFSDDPVFIKAKQNSPLATLATVQGAISPILKVVASSPIIEDDNSISGAVLSGFYIDSAFLDGIKNLTGLEITIFGGDTRSASTIFSSGGSSKLTGTKETNKAVLDLVLGQKQAYAGVGNINNRPYYLVYLPLKSYSQEIVGMVSAGKPQSILTQNVQESFKTTFTTSATLMLLAIFPALFVAKFIKDNITA